MFIAIGGTVVIVIVIIIIIMVLVTRVTTIGIAVVGRRRGFVVLVWRL